MNIEQFLTKEQPTVLPIGQTALEDRPVFKSAKRTSFNLLLASTFALGAVLISQTANALSEFDSAFDSVKSVSTTPAQTPTAKHSLPNFKNGQEVESYFLSESAANPFVSLATRMEGLMTTVYPDPATGRNIGIGYNMDEIGMGQAQRDFARIGMKKEHIQILVSKNEAKYNQVKITPNQAVELLLLIQPQFEKIAKDWIGNEVWAGLPQNQQASLSYLAYQTGGRIEKFKKAKEHISSGNDEQAKKQLVTYYQDRQGKWQKNDRFAKHVGHMWDGVDTYAQKAGVAPTNMGIVASTKEKDNSVFSKILNQKPQEMLQDVGQKIKTLRIWGEDEEPSKTAAVKAKF